VRAVWTYADIHGGEEGMMTRTFFSPNLRHGVQHSGVRLPGHLPNRWMKNLRCGS
jgi:hypothetical protein